MVVSLTLPAEAEPYRAEVRAWLAEHPEPSARELADAGYVVPHWPRPWGRDASPIEQLAIGHEMRAAKVRRPFNPVGIGWAGPTILQHGTTEQQQRWLPGIIDGSELWCQLFSEPDAGSDLARLGTRAVRDGDEWVVTGQKLWPGLADIASHGILLARTDPDAQKHRGITYFVCPMDRPGIEVRPLVSMTGESEFNEVFFNDARLPADCVVGEVDRGWDLAKVTLANERVGLSTAGAFWGGRPTADDIVELVRSRGGLADLVRRQEVAAVWSEWRVLEVLGARMAAAAVQGRPPGPEASVRKALSDRHGQRMLRLGRDLAGAHGVLADAGPFGVTGGRWTFGFLFSPALTIGGGTAEVQRNVIAERILGLPREPDADAELPWSART
jgi:alkylation response protein AidB-like acyl-CoA dehydrogenase